MDDEQQEVGEVVKTLQRFDQALKDYYDNADYESERDPDKCRAFIVACRRLIQLTPQASEHGGANERASFDVRLLAEERKDAQKWLAATLQCKPPRLAVVVVSLCARLVAWMTSSRKSARS